MRSITAQAKAPDPGAVQSGKVDDRQLEDGVEQVPTNARHSNYLNDHILVSSADTIRSAGWLTRFVQNYQRDFHVRKSFIPLVFFIACITVNVLRIWFG